MFEQGDAVLHDVLVGIVVDVHNDKLVCKCSDGTEKEFEASKCMKVSSYSDTLKSMRNAILGTVQGAK